MNDHTVAVYRALTALDAQTLADRLKDAGIESFADRTDSPLDGLVVGPHSKIVYVRRSELPEAQSVVRRFEAEGFVGVPRAEWPREEAGLELGSFQRPSTESPSQDIEGQGVERLDAERPGPPTPEVENLQLDGPRGPGAEVEDPQIKGFGADRPLAQPPDMANPEVEDQPIDQLDVTRDRSERELGTPAANLRPPKRKQPRRR